MGEALVRCLSAAACRGDAVKVHTHADLCALAVRWLKRPQSAGGHGCLVAISEARPEGNGECPDAIGFRAGWNDGSVLVECKVSRSDFLADKSKPHRQPGCGMGTWRYYMAPAGLLKVSDLPERWGLLEVNARGHVVALSGPAMHRQNYCDHAQALEDFRHESSDVARERALLVRLLARVGDVEAANLRIREALGAQQRMAVEIDKLRQKLRDSSQRGWTSSIGSSP